MDKYLPPIFLISFLIRILALGATLGDAVVTIALSALYAASVYWGSKKPTTVNKAILDRLVELEESHKVTKDKVASLTLGSAFRK